MPPTSNIRRPLQATTTSTDPSIISTAPVHHRRSTTGRAVRTNTARPNNYYARPPISSRSAGAQASSSIALDSVPQTPQAFFPALQFLADAVTALPREVVRQFTLMKEVEAKINGPHEKLGELLDGVTELAVPARKSVEQDGGNTKLTAAAGSTERRQHKLALFTLTANNSLAGSASASVVNGVPGSLLDEVTQQQRQQQQTPESEEELTRRKRYLEVRQLTASLLPNLDEKNVVLAEANRVLALQLIRIDSVLPHVDAEISEEARWGSMTHWAYSDNRRQKQQQGQAGAMTGTGSNRRDVAAANSLAAAANAIHETEIQQARRDAGRETQREKGGRGKRVAAEAGDEDFDDRPMKRVTAKVAKGKALAAAAAAAAASTGLGGFGISNTTNNGEIVVKKQRKADSKLNAPDMQRTLSSKSRVARAGLLQSANAETTESSNDNNRKTYLQNTASTATTNSKAKAPSAPTPTPGTTKQHQPHQQQKKKPRALPSGTSVATALAEPDHSTTPLAPGSALSASFPNDPAAKDGMHFASPFMFPPNDEAPPSNRPQSARLRQLGTATTMMTATGGKETARDEGLGSGINSVANGNATPILAEDAERTMEKKSRRKSAAAGAVSHKRKGSTTTTGTAETSGRGGEALAAERRQQQQQYRFPAVATTASPIEGAHAHLSTELADDGLEDEDQGLRSQATDHRPPSRPLPRTSLSGTSKSSSGRVSGRGSKIGTPPPPTSRRPVRPRGLLRQAAGAVARAERAESSDEEPLVAVVGQGSVGAGVGRRKGATSHRREVSHSHLVKQLASFNRSPDYDREVGEDGEEGQVREREEGGAADVHTGVREEADERRGAGAKTTRSSRPTSSRNTQMQALTTPLSLPLANDDEVREHVDEVEGLDNEDEVGEEEEAGEQDEQDDDLPMPLAVNSAPGVLDTIATPHDQDPGTAGGEAEEEEGEEQEASPSPSTAEQDPAVEMDETHEAELGDPEGPEPEPVPNTQESNLEEIAAEEFAGEEDSASSHDPDSPSEPKYCYCQRGSYGSMIACDNEACSREWFHLECTGLLEAPAEEEGWWCRDCAPRFWKGRGSVGAAEGGERGGDAGVGRGRRKGRGG